MTVYFITGKLGGGKTLAAVHRIHEYLNRGCVVATNVDLYLDKMLSKHNKTAVVYRLPDKPSVHDLETIGVGNSGYDEEKNGAIVLDECGTWFNSRSWNDKSRQPVIDWLLHARKLGWDVYLLVQDIALVDKQARDAVAEHVVYCRRLDRVSIPFVTWFFSLFGVSVRLPRLHVAVVKYGDGQNAIVVDRWWYRGSEYYSAYDTKQCFSDSSEGVYQLLSPFYLAGRFCKDRFSFIRLAVSCFFRWRLQVPAVLIFSWLFFDFLSLSSASVDSSSVVGPLPAPSPTPVPTPLSSGVSNYLIVGSLGRGRYLFEVDGVTYSTSDLRGGW